MSLSKLSISETSIGVLSQMLVVRMGRTCVQELVLQGVKMTLIASMVPTSASKLVLKMMDVEKQSNGSDCDVVAIAYLFDICSSFNPCQVRFNHRMIWQHLVMCLVNCQLSRFPVQSERKTVTVKSSKRVDLHCFGYMPEQAGNKIVMHAICIG